MYKMIFEYLDKETLEDKNLSLAKIKAFVDEILLRNDYAKLSDEACRVVYQSNKKESDFEDLLGIELTLTNQTWLADCLSDWYLLSDEDSADGSFQREEILHNKYSHLK